MILDHPIYGLTKNVHTDTHSPHTPQTVTSVDNHHDKGDKTPRPNVKEETLGDMDSPIKDSMSSSDDDLGRRGLPSACIFVAKWVYSKTSKTMIFN